MMARLRSDQTDLMRGSLRAGPHGWDALYMLNGELYRTQFCATEALARADLATHQDALGRRLAAGPVSPVTTRRSVCSVWDDSLRRRASTIGLSEPSSEHQLHDRTIGSACCPSRQVAAAHR